MTLELSTLDIPFRPSVKLYNKGVPDSSALPSPIMFDWESDTSWEVGLTDLLALMTSRLAYLESLQLGYVTRFYDYANTHAFSLDLVDYSQLSLRQFNKLLGLFLTDLHSEFQSELSP